MLEDLGIYKKREVEVIHEIRMESFCTAIEVEMAMLHDMLYEGVLPAISKQMILEKKSLDSLEGMDFKDSSAWKALIVRLGTLKTELLREADVLGETKERLDTLPARERAAVIVNEGVPLMRSIRKKCDAAEELISSEIWPYPAYRNLLSLSA